MIKRPILIITICYIIGIILGLYLKMNIAFFAVSFIGICCLITAILFICSKKYLNNNFKKYYKVIIICVLSISISYISISKKEERFVKVQDNISGERNFIGVITNVNKETQYYKIYTVKIQENVEDNSSKNIKILLKVRKDNHDCNLKYGYKIQCIGNIEKPEVRRNYKGFDYSKYLKTQNVYGICEVNSNNISVLKENSVTVYGMCIIKIRNHIKNNLMILLPEKSANIAIPLLLGDTSTIEEEQKTIFSSAGLSHILAISGMHVSFIIACLNFVLKHFDKRKSKYIFIIALLFFSIFTGGTPSVIRAVIMNIIYIFSKLVYRKSDTLTNISVAALMLLFLNPYNVLNLGFQLSFLGTLGIVVFNAKILGLIGKIQCIISSGLSKDIRLKMISKFLNKICTLFSVSISANLMIFPVIAYTYNSVSFVFVISNILVAPIVGLMCFLGYLTCAISLISINFANIFSSILIFLINIFEYIAKISSYLFFFRFTIKTPSVFLIICYYLIIYYLVFFYNKKHNKTVCKIMIALIILAIIINTVLRYNLQFKIYFVDVGQGDSTLIVTKTNKTILIDGGGSENNSYDVGENVLVPYLLDREIVKIDYLIISHFDSDHVKGLFNVIKKLDVKNAIISKQGKISDNYSEFLQLSKKYKVNVIYIENRKTIKNRL